MCRHEALIALPPVGERVSLVPSTLVPRGSSGKLRPRRGTGPIPDPKNLSQAPYVFGRVDSGGLAALVSALRTRLPPSTAHSAISLDSYSLCTPFQGQQVPVGCRAKGHVPHSWLHGHRTESPSGCHLGQRAAVAVNIFQHYFVKGADPQTQQVRAGSATL